MTEQKTKKYKQRFRIKWLENELFRDWLIPHDKDPYVAQCKACNCFLKAKLNDLIMHRKSKKHNLSISNFESIFESCKSIHFSPTDIKKQTEDLPNKSECCSLPLRQPASEKNLEDKIKVAESLINIKVQGSSNHQDDFESHSGNLSPNSVSSEIRRHQAKFLSLDTFSRNQHYEYLVSDDPDFNAVYPKLVLSSHNAYNDSFEDELCAFGRSIVAQMRKLPEEKTVRLTGKIQNLIMQTRIKHLEEEKSKKIASSPPVITVSYNTPNSISQSSQFNTIPSYQ